jgi:putative ABC transport system permease protein
MHLPLSYSLRNLRRRPWRTAMTIASAALVVFACVLILSLSRGLYKRLGASGEPSNLLLISRKGQNIMFSDVKEDEIADLSNLPGLAKGPNGEFLISPEIMHVGWIETKEANKTRRLPVQIRGVNPVAWDVHRAVRVTQGNLPAGPYEVLAGRAAYIKLGVPAEKVVPGEKLHFEKQEWTVCGLFEAGNSLFESELWVNESDILASLRRQTHSFVVLRLEGVDRVAPALQEFQQAGPFERSFKGWSERGYYEELSKSLNWVFYLSIFMVAAITAAGLLAGINTMYAAVMSRMREIATLRVLGFRRRNILAGQVVESLVMSVAGGVLGLLVGSLANGIPMKMSQGAFYLCVDGTVVAVALGLTFLMGFIGGLLPAIRCLRLSIPESFRAK